MITAEQAVTAAMLICLSGALATLLLPRAKAWAGWIAFLAVASSSLLLLCGVATVLWSGPAKPMTLLAVPQLGFALRVYVDGLSALFLGLIATVALPSTFYSIEYMSHRREHGAGRYYPNFLLFVAGMYGLVSTTDMMYGFCLFWQMMTLAGYALIRHERRRPENAKAAVKYFWMMQIACAAAMLGAGILAGEGRSTETGEVLVKYDFDAILYYLPCQLQTQGPWAALAFALFLVGFGIKLGMWPFGQIWLPDAHPAAPSPVSAMLSGVMIKTGLYGLMRCFLWLVPNEARADYPVAIWGTVIAVLGTITLFTGTVQALKEDQAKRLLAFSSIGQAGYLLLGLGTCLILLGQSSNAALALAAAALYGALFHTLNHGVFKTLLFLNAGSVLHATGTQDLNKLGGLLRFMPVTAVTALIASLSIAGVPLLSGFASKWAIYVAAIQGSGTSGLLPLFALVAMFTSAITLALFIKFYGMTFLSRTSALVAERVGKTRSLEVGWKMRIPQIGLASLCVLVGLVPMLALSIVSRALAASRQGLGLVLANAAPAPLGTWAGLASVNQRSLYMPLVVAAVLVLLFLGVRTLASLGGAPRRVTEPWLCGYAREAELYRYRANSLYGELKRYFAWLGSASRPVAEPARPAEKQTKEVLAWSLEKN